jgi:hypothetical protein
MSRRLDLGRALLAAGAVLLLVTLFLDWFDTGQTGWEVFEALDLLLAGLALAALYAAFRLDVIYDWVPVGLAGATLAIVVVQLIDPPPAAGNGDPDIGAWLALAAGALMAVGAALALARFAITVEMRDRDRRHRVPAVDRKNSAVVEPDETTAPASGELGRTETFTALPEDEEAERT